MEMGTFGIRLGLKHPNFFFEEKFVENGVWSEVVCFCKHWIGHKQEFVCQNRFSIREILSLFKKSGILRFVKQVS